MEACDSKEASANRETVLAGALPAGAGTSSCDHCAVSLWYHGVFRMADAGIRVVMVSCVIDSSFAGGSQVSKGASNSQPIPTVSLLIYRRMNIVPSAHSRNTELLSNGN